MSALTWARIGPRPIFLIPCHALLATFFTTLPTFLISFPKKFSKAGSTCTAGEYCSRKVSISRSTSRVSSRGPNSRAIASTMASDSRASWEKR